MAREYKMYINGKWVDALDGGRYDDANPSHYELSGIGPFGRVNQPTIY